MERDGKIRFGENYRQDPLEVRRYMPGLDGLRALAVLAVIAYHLNPSWAPGGLLGVCIFFVLSGYLITDILVVPWKSSGGMNLKEFWLGRARRLLPALFVMLTAVIVWISVCDPTRLLSLWNDVLAAIFYSSNWWLILHKVSYFASFGPPSPFGHLWSLAVEEQFYLVWPLLLGVGLRYIPQRRRLIGLIMALAVASAAAMAIIYTPGLDPSRVYYGTDTRAFALLIGAVLALVWPSRELSADLPPERRLILDAVGGAGLLVLLLMIWKSNQYQTFLYYGGLVLFSIAAAAVIAVLAHPASRLGRIFGTPPLRWLGVWSYGIYLWHYPVIVLTSPAVNTGGVNIELALGQTALSIALAAISWYFIEDPIRRGKWKPSLRWLSYGLKWRPKLLGVRGKAATIGSIVLLSYVFIMVMSGCGVISQAEPPNTKAEIVSGMETTMPAETESSASKGNGAEEESGTEVVNPGTDKNAVFTGQGVTVIGDSVMVEMEPELKKLFPNIIVDAAIGRQMYQAPKVIEKLKEQGILGKTVIIELGANGSFTEKQLIDILNSLGNDRQIILVNTRVPKPWESVVNQILAQAAADPKIRLVDWYSASSGHNDYFYPDGVHLKEAGVKAYLALVASAIAPDLLDTN